MNLNELGDYADKLKFCLSNTNICKWPEIRDVCKQTLDSFMDIDNKDLIIIINVKSNVTDILTLLQARLQETDNFISSNNNDNNQSTNSNNTNCTISEYREYLIAFIIRLVEEKIVKHNNFSNFPYLIQELNKGAISLDIPNNNADANINQSNHNNNNINNVHNTQLPISGSTSSSVGYPYNYQYNQYPYPYPYPTQSYYYPYDKNNYYIQQQYQQYYSPSSQFQPQISAVNNSNSNVNNLNVHNNNNNAANYSNQRHDNDVKMNHSSTIAEVDNNNDSMNTNPLPSHLRVVCLTDLFSSTGCCYFQRNVECIDYHFKNKQEYYKYKEQLKNYCEFYNSSLLNKYRSYCIKKGCERTHTAVLFDTNKNEIIIDENLKPIKRVWETDEAMKELNAARHSKAQLVDVCIHDIIGACFRRKYCNQYHITSITPNIVARTNSICAVYQTSFDETARIKNINRKLLNEINTLNHSNLNCSCQGDKVHARVLVDKANHSKIYFDFNAKVPDNNHSNHSTSSNDRYHSKSHSHSHSRSKSRSRSNSPTSKRKSNKRTRSRSRSNERSNHRSNRPKLYDITKVIDNNMDSGKTNDIVTNALLSDNIVPVCLDQAIHGNCVYTNAELICPLKHLDKDDWERYIEKLQTCCAYYNSSVFNKYTRLCGLEHCGKSHHAILYNETTKKLVIDKNMKPQPRYWESDQWKLDLDNAKNDKNSDLVVVCTAYCRFGKCREKKCDLYHPKKITTQLLGCVLSLCMNCTSRKLCKDTNCARIHSRVLIDTNNYNYNNQIYFEPYQNTSGQPHTNNNNQPNTTVITTIENTSTSPSFIDSLTSAIDEDRLHNHVLPNNTVPVCIRFVLQGGCFHSGRGVPCPLYHCKYHATKIKDYCYAYNNAVFNKYEYGCKIPNCNLIHKAVLFNTQTNELVISDAFKPEKRVWETDETQIQLSKALINKVKLSDICLHFAKLGRCGARICRLVHIDNIKSQDLAKLQSFCLFFQGSFDTANRTICENKDENNRLICTDRPGLIHARVLADENHKLYFDFKANIPARMSKMHNINQNDIPPRKLSKHNDMVHETNKELNTVISQSCVNIVDPNNPNNKYLAPDIQPVCLFNKHCLYLSRGIKCAHSHILDKDPIVASKYASEIVSYCAVYNCSLFIRYSKLCSGGCNRLHAAVLFNSTTKSIIIDKSIQPPERIWLVNEWKNDLQEATLNNSQLRPICLHNNIIGSCIVPKCKQLHDCKLTTKSFGRINSLCPFFNTAISVNLVENLNKKCCNNSTRCANDNYNNVDYKFTCPLNNIHCKVLIDTNDHSKVYLDFSAKIPSNTQ